MARKLVNGRKILLRMDSANDALENYAVAAEEGIDYLVKHNWRTENLDARRGDLQPYAAVSATRRHA